MALVKTISVRKVFRNDDTAFEALRGIDLSIEEGDFISITGESGSGKSTLLSILGGIAPPTEGEVIIDTIPIYMLPMEELADFRREYIGFVFQQFHLISYLTAVENVMLPLSITDMEDKKELALSALERVGLRHKAERLPSELSGGEMQRVAIARALVNEPPIILADEPTGNLDTKTGDDIFALFEELNYAGQTVILVTHNPELAYKTQKTITMKDGLITSITEQRKGNA
jgi:putative ABC transport system ATP-binding protein